MILPVGGKLSPLNKFSRTRPQNCNDISVLKNPALSFPRLTGCNNLVNISSGVANCHAWLWRPRQVILDSNFRCIRQALQPPQQHQSHMRRQRTLHAPDDMFFTGKEPTRYERQRTEHNGKEDEGDGGIKIEVKRGGR